MILGNYKKSFEVANKFIDNKNIQKFICDVDKNLKLIGITNTGKVFHIDWESNINNDYKLDNKILGNLYKKIPLNTKKSFFLEKIYKVIALNHDAIEVAIGIIINPTF